MVHLLAAAACLPLLWSRSTVIKYAFTSFSNVDDETLADLLVARWMLRAVAAATNTTATIFQKGVTKLFIEAQNYI